MAITLTDKRGELYQWDTGRTLTVDDATVTQVHFQNRAYGRTIDVDVKDGTAIVPDELLQKAGELRVYAFAGTAASGFTKVERVYNIVRRNKPNDYMYTPTEQKSLEGLQKQIGDLNDLETKAKDNLVAAINEANKSGGGGEITSEDIKNALGYIPVNPFWVHATIVNYTNATIEESLDEIIAAAADSKIVAMIAEFVNEKNALQATAIIPLTAIQGAGKSVHFAAMGETYCPMTITITMRANQSTKVQLSGIVTSIDDEVGDVTSNAVKFEPQSLNENEKAQARKNIGINPDEKTSAMTNPVGVDSDGKLWSKADTSLNMTGATVGQIAKITAVDDSGKPTAWEAVDMTSGGEQWEKIAEIDFDVDAANDVSVWEYQNLPNYKELAYRKVSLTGSTEKRSGLTISINGSQSLPSCVEYSQNGGQSNGWGKILLLPFGWIHVNSGSANSPTNYAQGGVLTAYNAIPFDGDSITSVRLSSHPTYKIAGGKLSLYGRK